MAESKTYLISDAFNCAVCGTEICINRSLIGLKEGVKFISYKCPVCGFVINKAEEKKPS